MFYISLFISFVFPFSSFNPSLILSLEFVSVCPNYFVVCDLQELRTFSNVSVVQGTTFVLQKNTEPRQRFLSVISKGSGVMEV